MGFQPLDKRSHIPLYLQLTTQLIHMIEKGELNPGDKVVSERELSEQLNISRITARLAIQELLKSGLVFREQGLGTFVAESKMRNVQGFTSFTEDMKKRGLKPGSHVLMQEVLPADDSIANVLHVRSGDPVLHLVRLRLADERPIAIQYHDLPARLVPGLDKEDLTNQSLFAILREKYFLYPEWTEAVVEASAASQVEAQLLGLKPGEPVLAVKGLTFTNSFELVESVRTLYPSRGLALYIGRQRIGNLTEGI